MKTFILAAIAMATVHAVSVYDVVLDEWKLYKTSTRRHFRSADEELQRLHTFMRSKDLIERHNTRYLNGLEHYSLALNSFADHFPYENVEQGPTLRYMEEIEELRRSSTGVKIEIPDGASVPDEVDWHAMGAVNPVWNQQTCGSCYAFTSAAALEAQVFISSKTLPSLSMQQILDCSKEFGNHGCSGGSFAKAFKYLKKTGLAAYDDYPYENKDGECRSDGKNLSPVVKMHYYMYDGNEEKLKYAVATYGPMAIGINVSPKTFQLYKSGVYTDTSCSSTLVHAVLLTGYGKDPATNLDYWIIKNSWGPEWGENGFMKMGRNMNNLCGIGTLAYVPKLE